jgi:hypothetical protein
MEKSHHQDTKRTKFHQEKQEVSMVELCVSGVLKDRCLVLGNDDEIASFFCKG